jgi:uncharacterized protein YecE (DUF72 family)
MPFIGTAAWSIPKSSADRFPATGSSLMRYASVFDGVEINSSFYRRHKLETWQRWADSVPDHFRFAVKVPKEVTHVLRLVGAEAVFDTFLQDIQPLGEKLGPVLLQLPPNFAFDAPVAAAFFDHIRSVFAGCLVIEPRHQGWGSVEALTLLSEHRLSRVIADPAVVRYDQAETGDFLYIRLHGSPRMYYSEYRPDQLKAYADTLAGASPESWCIFDNTASGAALVNALEMLDLMRSTKNAPAGADAFHETIMPQAQNL